MGWNDCPPLLHKLSHPTPPASFVGNVSKNHSNRTKNVRTRKGQSEHTAISAERITDYANVNKLFTTQGDPGMINIIIYVHHVCTFCHSRPPNFGLVAIVKVERKELELELDNICVYMHRCMNA